MNRLEWILGILLAIMLIIVAVLSIFLWFRTDEPIISSGTPSSSQIATRRANQIEPSPQYEGRTAKIAFATAQRTAFDWQADAKLLNANATWPQGSTVDELSDGSSAWSFTFYSPQTNRVATIGVVDNVATLVGQNDYQQNTPPLEVTGWNLDSQEAIQLLMNEGGRKFLEDNGITTLVMQLSTTQDNSDRIEWFVSLIGLQTGNELLIRIDATSGEILEVQN